MSYDNSIFKFKEKVRDFNKIKKDLIKPVSESNNMKPIQIFVKEDNKKTVYIEESKSDHGSVESKDEESPKKELKKISSEPNLEIPQEEKETNNLLNSEKICLIIGGFPDIINALTKRGWKETKEADPKIITYNFLYTLKIADIPFEELKTNVIVNHFKKIGEFTKKTGLLKNIRSLYYMKVCPDDFYPRAYDLGEKQDVEDFIEDFKTSKAISLLINCKELKGKNVNKEEVITSLNIIKRKLNLLLGITDLENKFNTVKRTFSRTYEKNDKLCIEKVSDKEWEIISNENMDFYREQMENISKQGLYPRENKKTNLPVKAPSKNTANNKNLKPKNKINPENKKNANKNEYIQSEEDKKLEEEIKADFKNQEKERKIEKEKLDKIIQEKEEERLRQEKELELKKQLEEDKKKNKEKEKPLTKEEKEQKWKEETFLNNTSNNLRPERLPQTDDVSDLLPEITEILEKLSKSLPQFDFNGTKNIWIVKPSGLSRGRGISCIDQLNDILTNIKLHNQTVIQKYIERPLVIKGRKFDIRQWVLVTDFNPLTIYLFDTPYIRFGAEEYHLEDFKNIFSQLTGNSIAKHSQKFENSEIEGDMWETYQFRDYLKEKFGRDCWPEIQEKIKKIVIYALSTANHKVINRQNSHEVLGFDIMIDESLNVYLIEINLSPDWTYSTKVTEKMIKIASEDMMKVVIDVAQEQLKPVEERKDIDTGSFKLIYSSSKFPKFDKPFVNRKY